MRFVTVPMALGVICLCCGERFAAHVGSANPNICVSCTQLLEDDSPLMAARSTEAVIAYLDPVRNEKRTPEEAGGVRLKPIDH